MGVLILEIYQLVLQNRLFLIQIFEERLIEILNFFQFILQYFFVVNKYYICIEFFLHLLVCIVIKTYILFQLLNFTLI